MATQSKVSYLTQEEAVKVDEELMGPLGFSVDQLMELAGLSVACALAAEYPHATHPRVLVLVGPGNNGGDGLVAARHLYHFGYSVQICYPKRTDKALYNGLVTQCESLGIEFRDVESVTAAPLAGAYDVVVDALFGFSFHGAPRPPFDALLAAVSRGAAPPPVVAVDIPSGWHVENGDVDGNGVSPAMLVSLTAPKLAARFFRGDYHYIGGRFVPPAIRDKFNLQLPAYPGTAMAVKLDEPTHNPRDMRVSYTSGVLEEASVSQDPFEQFSNWFDEAADLPEVKEANAMSLATATPDGKPSLRMVLLKGFDQRGFVFYTNYNSRKGRELDANKHAAMCMWWEQLQRSVRIEGTIERLSEAESAEYYHSRPRGSQLGAWVSQQSSVIPGRQVLEDKVQELKAKYADESVEIPKPPFWGGFRIQPTSIEFWQGRDSRLHDRLKFSRSDDAGWVIERLSP